MTMGDPKRPKFSLKKALDQAAKEVRNSPKWLRVIYERNREIERILKERNSK